MDTIIVVSALLAFCVFFAIHVATFRFLADEQILKMIVRVWSVGALLNVALAFSLTHSILATVVSMLIYGLLTFVYVLCIFGPFETSIRLRLIRELSKGPLTTEQIIERYNTKMILDTRLRRLSGGGDIICDGKYYLVSQQKNAFFMIDKIAKLLTTMIRSSK